MCQYHELKDDYIKDIVVTDKEYRYTDLVIDLTESWINQIKELNQVGLYKCLNEVINESGYGSLRDYVTGYYHLPSEATKYHAITNVFSDFVFAVNLLCELLVNDEYIRAFRPILKQQRGNDFLRFWDRLCRIKAFKLMKTRICEMVREAFNLDFTDPPLDALQCEFDFPIDYLPQH